MKGKNQVAANHFVGRDRPQAALAGMLGPGQP